MNINEFEELKKELSRENDLPISLDKIIEQVKTFEKGIPFLKFVYRNPLLFQELI